MEDEFMEESGSEWENCIDETLMKTIALVVLTFSMLACQISEDKQTQTLTFSDIAPLNLADRTGILKAVASSGLPVHFVSSDTSIATVVDSTVFLKKAGSVTITAQQQGNATFYEAPNVSKKLLIRDWDPNKKNQTIRFTLVQEWRISNGLILPLEGTASSDLPIVYTSSDWRVQVIENQLYLQHGTRLYDTWAEITASQSGNNAYNPADNVTCTIHVIGDEKH